MDSQPEIAIPSTELVPGVFYTHVIGIRGLDNVWTVAPHAKKTYTGTYVGVHTPTNALIFSLNGNHLHISVKEYELYYKESIFGVKHVQHDWMELTQKDRHSREGLHYKSIYGASCFVPAEAPANLDLVVIHGDLLEGHSYKTCTGRRNLSDGLYYAEGGFKPLGVYRGKEACTTFDGGHGMVYMFEDREGRPFKHYLNQNGSSCFQQMDV